MKKIIKVSDKEKEIIQVTIADERWYIQSDKFVPSVTWIAGFYPKGVGFYKWLANTGWDESEAIKNAAGDKGSKVHYAITDLLDGKEVRMDSKYITPTTEKEEELTLEEYEAILSFRDWFNDNQPEILSKEFVVFNEKEDYGGTVDLLCKIKGELWIVDNKTSKSIWPEHELQVSAYKHGMEKLKGAKLAILQLGYGLNRKGYKFTEIQDKFDLFLAAKKIWDNEVKDKEPKTKDYPEVLRLQRSQDTKLEK